MFYSKQTGGFYSREIHTSIPADAVEISSAEHAALINGQSEGKQIQADANGKPILVTPPPADPQIQINAESLAYLASTDWYVIRKQETGTDIPEDILTNRQAARDAIKEVLK